jgi:hypothetical protein
VSGHPCATDLTDNFFCFVWHEVDEVFVPWVRDKECVKREKERESERDRRENAREEG